MAGVPKVSQLFSSGEAANTLIGSQYQLCSLKSWLWARLACSSCATPAASLYLTLQALRPCKEAFPALPVLRHAVPMSLDHTRRSFCHQAFSKLHISGNLAIRDVLKVVHMGLVSTHGELADVCS